MQERRWFPPLAWGLWLGFLTLIQVAYGYWSFTSYAFLGGAAGGMVVFGAWLAWSHPPTPLQYELVDMSWWTVLCAVGACTAFLGAVFGLYLALPGLGLVAVAVGGLAREHRSQWRTR